MLNPLRLLSFVTALMTSCTTSRTPEPARATEPTRVSMAASRWASVTQSPWPAPTVGDREARLASACGVIDGALAGVAARLAEERARGQGTPDPDAVVARL